MKFSINLPQGVYLAIERIAGESDRTVADCIREILTEEAERSGHLPDDELNDVKRYRRLGLAVADAAEAIVSELGECPYDITAQAIRRCQNDPAWLADYRAYIRADPFEPGNPRKRNINPDFGYKVKRRLGASNRKKANGKDRVLKATDLIITNFTALEIR